MIEGARGTKARLRPVARGIIIAAMLYRLLRPLMFRLDAERAHDAAMRRLERLGRHPRWARFLRTCVARPVPRAVRIMGLEFPHTVGLAAGFDKNGRSPWGWFSLGFGFIELGTVTPRPQPGHPRPRMFRFPAMGGLVNRMGFNNDGAEAVAVRLKTCFERCGRPPFPIGISVGKNADTPLERAADDFAAAAERLSPLADFVTMNVSSPNTLALRDLQARAPLMRLVESVRAAAAGRAVLVKLAPELDEPLLLDVLDACAEAGAAGVIATNTLATAVAGRFIGDGAPRTPLPEGGLSGRPLRDISRIRVSQIRRHVGNRLAVVGCGGIDDAASARAMLDAGADLIQVYTGLVYRGPFLAARLSRAIAGMR